LLAAADWFNDAFVERLHAQGWPRLSRSQAMLLLRIDPGGNHPAELARRLEMTRQSMRELLQGLEAHGLVVHQPHPDDGRALLVTLSPRAHHLGMAAARVQLELDAELGHRIGAERVAQLRQILELDWGPPPS
jgi:DNA-binding MarR family transcriptional regulator